MTLPAFSCRSPCLDLCGCCARRTSRWVRFKFQVPSKPWIPSPFERRLKCRACLCVVILCFVLSPLSQHSPRLTCARRAVLMFMPLRALNLAGGSRPHRRFRGWGCDSRVVARRHRPAGCFVVPLRGCQRVQSSGYICSHGFLVLNHFFCSSRRSFLLYTFCTLRGGLQLAPKRHGGA